jgi:hypothetical protein
VTEVQPVTVSVANRNRDRDVPRAPLLLRFRVANLNLRDRSVTDLQPETPGQALRCVCLLLQYLLKDLPHGMCVCLLLQYLLQSCSRGGGGGNGGHVLRETTSQGRRELVCPSRSNERGGEGYCVKEGEGEEGERERERAGEVRLYCSLG